MTHDYSGSAVRSCFRCGAQFPTSDGERVCYGCRKPVRSARARETKTLTFRENQIVERVAQGKANKEIAFDLILTEGTIKEYLNRIFRKVNVSNRTELAIWFVTRQSTPEERLHESSSAFENRSLIV